MKTSLALAAAAVTLVLSASAVAEEVVIVRPARRGCARHWAEGPCYYPRLSLGLDMGVSSFNESGPFGFNTGIGKVTDAGPAWGGRIGVEFSRWFAVDAHYIGMYDGAKERVAPSGNLGLL